MINSNYFTDNAELETFFNDIIDWPTAINDYEDGFRDAARYKETQDENLAYAPTTNEEAIEGYRMLMESVGEVSGKTIAQNSQAMDHKGLKYADGKVEFPPEMHTSVNALIEAGLIPMSVTRQYGGLGLPVVAQMLQSELIARGDATIMITHTCYNIADTIERFASKELKDKYLPQITSGDMVGAMALTEPNFGSDLSNLATRAEKDENGDWRLTGTKRFITHAVGFGDRPSIIMTLARTGGNDSGARGLTMFLVHSDEIEVAGIEHKMGMHCSPTCEVVYDNSLGEIVGEPGEGLIKQAMALMNSARLLVAAKSMGTATAAYMEAKKYASVREQFGKTIDKIPGVIKMLSRMERELFACRSLLNEAAVSIDSYAWRTERLKEEGQNDKAIRKDELVKKGDKLASFLTPLSKLYVTEMTNKIAYDAIQIYGGAGYTEEYDVARIYRDARIFSIYEGTSQLQVVAAIGGCTAGMSAKGYLREYIDGFMATFTPSADIKEQYITFEETVLALKDIKDGKVRDEFAWELVDSAARFLLGMMMERNVSRIKSEEVSKSKAALTRDYIDESAAVLAANLIRVKRAGKVAVEA